MIIIKIRNPKSEIRNKFKIQMFKIQNNPPAGPSYKKNPVNPVNPLILFYIGHSDLFSSYFFGSIKWRKKIHILFLRTF